MDKRRERVGIRPSPQRPSWDWRFMEGFPCVTASHLLTIRQEVLFKSTDQFAARGFVLCQVVKWQIALKPHLPQNLQKGSCLVNPFSSPPPARRSVFGSKKIPAYTLSYPTYTSRREVVTRGNCQAGPVRPKFSCGFLSILTWESSGGPCPTEVAR